MISKTNCIWTVLLFASVLSAKETRIRLSNGQTAVLRPVLLRSEFVRSRTFRVFQQNSLRNGFDAHGFPIFKPVLKRNLHWNETKLAQTRYYARFLNREFKNYIIQHPEKFHPETIAAYKQGFTSKNPMLKDGTPLQWHHGKDGYELVSVKEHSGVPHRGGNQVYGYEYAKDTAKIPNREMILTARRWGKFVALDMVFSSICLASDGETNWQPYAVNAAASIGAGLVAWGVESLLVSSFPLLQGGTPLFIKGIAINLGGPASWIASGAYFLVKFAVMSGWKHYQVRAAWEVEKRCRESERRARIGLLKIRAKENTNRLKALAGI